MKHYRKAIYERVSGLRLDTIEKALSCSESLAIEFSREEEIVTDDIARKLLTKWVISKCSHKYEEFFSSYFHGKSMIVLFTLFFYLKSLEVRTLESVLNIVMNELEYANYLIPIRNNYRKYLKLFRKGSYLNS